jgi:hypothetical protein
MQEQQVLVALLRDKKDYAILRDEHWYRIPVEHTPPRWPPEFIGFYLPRAFGKEAFQVQYYGKIVQIEQSVQQLSFFEEKGLYKVGTEDDILD